MRPHDGRRMSGAGPARTLTPYAGTVLLQRSFHDREEIIALRNAITAIEWPDDELRVFATLHGPFFALGDEALLAFRQYADGNGALKTRRLEPFAVDAGAPPRAGFFGSSGGSDHGSRCSSRAAPDGVIATASRAGSLCDATEPR